MEEKYLISVRGRQLVDDEAGEVELTTRGSYVKRGDKRFIHYKEYDGDTGEASPATLKLEGSCLTLLRPGGTRLILEKGRRHLCEYKTEYGSMMLGVFTSGLDNQLGDKGGSLRVRYTLDMEASLASVNELTITVKEANDQDVQICGTSKGTAARSTRGGAANSTKSGRPARG